MEPSRRPLAAVTGASTGIGRALAEQFAGHGYDLVIAADEAEVEAAADALRRRGVAVEAVVVDLATPGGVEAFWDRVRADGRPLAAIAINAGIGVGGAFAETDLDRELRAIDLNVRSTVHLAKHAVRAMRARGAGRILVTSSIAASMPGPFQAVYNASKSFTQSFALALREELRGTGVTVTALMPGPTDTAFFARNEMLDTRLGRGRKDDPGQVAADAFAAMMEGRERVVTASLTTKAQQAATRLLPDAIKARIHRRMSAPGSARQAT